MEMTNLISNIFSNKNIQLNNNDAVGILSRSNLLAKTDELKTELEALADNILASKSFTNKLNNSMMLALFDNQKSFALVVDYETVMEWLHDYLHINHKQEEPILDYKFKYANNSFQRTFQYIIIEKLKNKLLSKGFKVNIMEQTVDDSKSKFLFDVAL